MEKAEKKQLFYLPLLLIGIAVLLMAVGYCYDMFVTHPTQVAEEQQRIDLEKDHFNSCVQENGNHVYSCFEISKSIKP